MYYGMYRRWRGVGLDWIYNVVGANLDSIAVWLPLGSISYVLLVVFMMRTEKMSPVERFGRPVVSLAIGLGLAFGAMVLGVFGAPPGITFAAAVVGFGIGVLVGFLPFYNF